MIVTILSSAIAISTVFLFGCVGEIIMEKAGHLNLGIPGVMCFGTLGGCVGVSVIMPAFSGDPYSAPWIVVVLFAVIFSVLFSAIAGLVYAFLTVTLKCNQNVTGLALTTFGAGIVDYFMTSVDKTYFTPASRIIRASLPYEALGGFGKIFLSHGILVYLAIAIAITSFLILKKTKLGLSLRAVGENPGTADAAGINVSAYKYGAILAGSGIAGLGGLFYVMDYVGGSWENSGTIQAFSWMAIALVIFCVWNPAIAIGGSFVFGLLFILPNYITGINFVTMKLFSIFPYAVTVLVLIVTSIIGKRNVQAPSALGLSYFREDR